MGQKGESGFSILRQMTKRFAMMRESFPFNCSLSPPLDHDFGFLFCLITEACLMLKIKRADLKAKNARDRDMT